MNTSLVRAKVLIPAVRPDSIVRPQLVELLNDGLKRRLILASAPAGYGKTTLLSSWARSCELPVAWLALDQGDNDPVRFLGYLGAALGEIDPALEKGLAGQFLSSAAGSPPSSEDLAAAVLNQLYTLRHGAILILDDYHLIQSQPVHQVLSFLLEHLPEPVHLVIASRADPPLPLARYRARGQLSEIRLVQLRFSLTEAAAFLRQSFGTDLTGPDVAALVERTEGWAAGLQLAALSMQGRTDLAEYVRQFTGSNRHILDYLGEEVLERQPEAIRNFLLKTSILERLNAGLCQALLAGEDPQAGLQASQDTLEYLDRSNLFVVPLDDRREWYRYHRLFADLLRKQLQRTRPDLAHGLHLRASAWFERQGLFDQAFEHLLAAGEIERAAGLVETACPSVLNRGEIATLAGWFQRLPVEVVQARPALDLYWLACQVIQGAPQEVLAAGFQRLDPHPELVGELSALRGYLAIFRYELSAAQECSSVALSNLSDRPAFFQHLAGWVQSAIQVGQSGLERRIEILQDQLQRSRASGNRLLWVNTLCSLAEVRWRQARLPLARDLYQQAIDDATIPGGRLLPVAGEALIGLGSILREWNRLDEALQLLEQGIELIRQVRQFGVIEGLMHLANCRQAMGDPAGARRALEEARQQALAFNLTEVDDRLVAYTQALILHRQGDRTAIQRYFDLKWSPPAHPFEILGGASGFNRGFAENIFHKYEQIAWARSQIGLGQPQAALDGLAALQPQMEAEERTRLVIEIKLLRALALLALGQPGPAQEAFEQALAAAEPAGLVRLWLDEGPAVLPLLRQALQNQVCPEYAGRLLAALEAEPGVQPSPALENAPASPVPAPGPLLEPLSTRELEVLRLLATDLSPREISDHLFVAESTLNSHLKNIYSKLGVHRRMQAVQRGRDLGLIY